MTARPVGRPRNRAADQAILLATRELLVVVGYPGLTIEAVAARAGVGKPTVYRRYPTKAVLVFDAVFGKTKAKSDPDTGSILTDLQEAYSWVVDEFAAPEALAALPWLFAELAANEQLAALIRETVVEPEYARVRSALERAQERGEIDADADLNLAIDAFTGTALARALLLDRPVDANFGEQLVHLILNGLASRRTHNK